MLTKSLEATLSSFKDKTGFTEKETTQCNTQLMQIPTIFGIEDSSVGQATPAAV